MIDSIDKAVNKSKKYILLAQLQSITALEINENKKTALKKACTSLSEAIKLDSI